MNLSHEGLSLRYDTPDAPAPAIVADFPPSLTIGVAPPSPSNSVAVRYRVDGGMTRTISAREFRTDYATQTQYFLATFPRIPDGDLVEYMPILSSVGRQVPAPGTERFLSSFRLVKPAAAPVLPRNSLKPQPRFAPRMEFICNVTAQLAEPEVLGPCPDGLRINFHVTGGKAVGPKLNATIRPRGCDSMIIRRDGLGICRIRAVVETDDGALVAAEYDGVYELGEGGYEKALLGQFPERPPVELAPRFYTSDSRYLWANRLQFVGVGHVVMAELRVEYDLYAVHTDRIKPP